MKALPPATGKTITIQTPFGSYGYVMNLAINHIQFMRREGYTEYGLLCWPFKLNGAWAAVGGRCE